MFGFLKIKGTPVEPAPDSQKGKENTLEAAGTIYRVRIRKCNKYGNFEDIVTFRDEAEKDKYIQLAKNEGFYINVWQESRDEQVQKEVDRIKAELLSIFANELEAATTAEKEKFMAQKQAARKAKSALIPANVSKMVQELEGKQDFEALQGNIQGRIIEYYLNKIIGE